MCGHQPTEPLDLHKIDDLVDAPDALVIKRIMSEVARAREKWPAWPYDNIHAAAIVGEEAGELIQAVVQEKYQPEKQADPYVEAVQTAAMCIRFLTGE